MAKVERRGLRFTTRVSVVDSVTGNRSQRRITGRSKREVEREAMRLRGEAEGGLPADNRLTLGSFLEDRWLPHIRRSGIRERTVADYERMLRVYTIPVIGNQKLGRVRPLHIQAVVDAAVGRGLGPLTVRNVFRPLSQALRQAVRWQLIPFNHAAAVELPKAMSSRRPVPTPEEFARILEFASGSRYAGPLRLAILTGLRRGEVLGLTWEAVDLGNAVIHVHRSLQGYGRSRALGEPKTESALRTVGLTPAAIRLFQRQRAEQGRRRLLTGVSSKEDVVFDNDAGSFLALTEFSAAYKRWARKAGLADSVLHDTRRAFATRIAERERNPKVVQAVLGHASPGFSLTVYARATTEMARSAAEAIADAYDGLPSLETE
ncbi:MAG: site-specific integrase [Actinomycetota bacterium]